MGEMSFEHHSISEKISPYFSLLSLRCNTNKIAILNP